jgi:ribosomal protein S12 methylthiotransferase accessory factor
MSTTIQVSFPGNKRVDAQVGDWTIRTDQSAKGGGDASAAEPFSHFLASIATCAGIYALGFCQARKLDATGLDLAMEYDYDPKGKRLTKVAFRLTLPHGFPDKYRDAIVRAMNQCTVKRCILEPAEFETIVTN